MKRGGITRLMALLAALAVAAACSTDDDGTPSGDGGKADAGSCGNVTCAPGELCIRPCCGGAPPLCEPATDGGACPPGTTYTDFCELTGQAGCQHGPCTPPPPYCSTVIPSGCVQQNGDVVCTCA